MLSKLGTYIANKILAYLSHAVLAWLEKQVQLAKQKKALAELEKKTNDPKTTPSEAKDNYADFINKSSGN